MRWLVRSEKSQRAYTINHMEKLQRLEEMRREQE